MKADLQQLKKDDKEIGEMIIELEKSKNVHSITRTERGKSNSSGFDREKAKKDIPQGSIINYDPDVKTDINGNHRTPRIGLSHELQHSSDVDKGIMSYENIGNGIPMREIRAINTENKIRKRTGDAKRTEYRGRKIPQNCWNKIILMLGINLLFVMCVHKTSERYEDMFVDSTWQSPFVAMNIEYKDSVYSIVPREGDMYLFLNDGVANKKYRYELFPILLEQTLGIDSITFCSLKEMDCMVTPQPYIDSIYKGKVENLISLLFNEKGVLSVRM